MDLEAMIIEQGKAAKKAARKMTILTSAKKNKALLAMADILLARQDVILKANAIDMEAAKNKNISNALLDRLYLSPERIEKIAAGIRQIAALEDPVGSGDFTTVRPNGLEIRRVRVPLGVVGIIYEARPNVTADAAALCLKSGNAVILRGGSEAINSNQAIALLLAEAAAANGIPEGAIQFIARTDRQAVDIMLHLRKYLDVIIPRGGASLINHVVENSTVPVIETGRGICHLFVDDTADFAMAEKLIVNAKTSRPAVCNALETLLVHEKAAAEFLPLIVKALRQRKVELRGCEKTCALCGDMLPAAEQDWQTEYGDLILSIKIVRDVQEAVEHINTYNTGHSETIVTNNLANAIYFQQNADAAVVYVNASTRFTDGGEFGFGAEIGISTQKLHARGPMGLRELTTVKYLVQGNGQIR